MKNRVKEIRKEKGITQIQLSEELGVSRQTISTMESGRYNPSLKLALKISKYFQKPIEEIFIYDEE